MSSRPIKIEIRFNNLVRLPPIFISAIPSALIIEVFAADFAVTSFGLDGAITWTNAFSNGICTIETASQPLGEWSPVQNLFTTNLAGSANFDLTHGSQFIRLLALDISSNAINGFGNLTMSYGRMHTIAGNGCGREDITNYWQASFENGPATNAALSRPHIAMADGDGNIYIADKDSHSVLKVTADGTIHTVAGTHFPGNGGDKPDFGTNVALNFPNGLWVRRDGTVYILDTNNGKVRRLIPGGIITTLFSLGHGINVDTGRGLWVSDDETLVYFANGTVVMRWTRSNA